jgi:hypothetical protein
MMMPLLNQILLFMTGTFVLGMLLGWLLRNYGIARKVTMLNAEVIFWKEKLEQSRLEGAVGLENIALDEVDETASTTT